ncbi:hypothetical protein [Nonomuraea sp. NEAU-A123]|uniref:hypothetical protein n=1 Tax=Nonomuraea sp. NEAU-A123 TaxID=2839649 RepID=UPI001BE4B2CE|nr:hypothetical protein [Nonomuraea sp. NEAU-A123]MBT2224794.1 hypothetical protein [Nonomuraea sp. NEAU-A123]
MDEFRMVHEFSLSTAIRLCTPLVLLIPVFLVLRSIPGSDIEVGVIAAAATMIAMGVRLARYRQLVTDTVVRFSAQGVEMTDAYGSRVRLAWRNIEGIDVVDSRVPSPHTVIRADGTHIRTGTRKCVGVVGWGEYQLSPRAPGWLISHLDRLPVDPVIGLPKLSIPLGVVDPLWEHGPMGDRVRRQRPDLFRGLRSVGVGVEE